MTAQQSLVPPDAVARCERHKRLGIAFGARFFVLLAGGLIWAGLLIFDPRYVYALVLWDATALLLWAIDLWRIPPPSAITIRRTFNAPLSLAVRADVQLFVTNSSARDLHIQIVDTVPTELREQPPAIQLDCGAGAEARGAYDVSPRERGARTIGPAYVRYGTGWRLAERWARAPLTQDLIVYPNLMEASHQSILAAHARLREGRRRPRHIRGAGRIVDSLREYQPGDDIRDVCWTATARRAKLVCKNYVIEPNQHIWIIVDTGRLMRTRVAGAVPGGADASKLDRAVNAALALAAVALAAGDRVSLLAYGRRVRTKVSDARGEMAIRQFVEPLARLDAEELEADHLLAAGQLAGNQKRRALVVWITDLPDMAVTPHVIRAARSLMPRHLVLFAVMGQADLEQTAGGEPETVGEMYRAAAAQEVMHRRTLQIARLRTEGALAFEVTEGLSAHLVNTYLDVKERGLL